MDCLLLLRDTLHHMAWADVQVWNCVLSSPAALEDPGLRQSLHHVHLVQRAFLCVWKRHPLELVGDESQDIRRLAAWADDIRSDLLRHVDSLTPEALDHKVVLPWAARLTARLPQPTAEPSLGESLLQVALHSSHHRGQLCTRLRELGAAPPAVDFILWVYAGKPTAGSRA